MIKIHRTAVVIMSNKLNLPVFTHLCFSSNFTDYIHGCEKMDLDKKIEAEDIQRYEGEITAISKIENQNVQVGHGKRNLEDKKVVA